jgi:hypothetical protein
MSAALELFPFPMGKATAEPLGPLIFHVGEATAEPSCFPISEALAELLGRPTLSRR